jgi:hypothetical protein
MKPKSSVRTQRAGWMATPDNISYDESIAIARKIKLKDHQTSKIILDFTKRVVVKNTWNDGRSFEEMFSYFYNGYPQYINPILKELGYSVQTTDRSVPEAEITEVTPQSVGTSISSN